MTSILDANGKPIDLNALREPQTARVGWLLSLSLDRRGVAAWHTVEARIDEDGLPSPAEQSVTPCAKRGDTQPRLCRMGVAVEDVPPHTSPSNN